MQEYIYRTLKMLTEIHNAPAKIQEPTIRNLWFWRGAALSVAFCDNPIAAETRFGILQALVVELFLNGVPSDDALAQTAQMALEVLMANGHTMPIDPVDKWN